MSDPEDLPCGIKFDCDYGIYWTVDREGRSLKAIKLEHINKIISDAWRLKKAAQNYLNAEILTGGNIDSQEMIAAHNQLQEVLNDSKEVIPWNP